MHLQYAYREDRWIGDIDAFIILEKIIYIYSIEL